MSCSGVCVVCIVCVVCVVHCALCVMRCVLLRVVACCVLRVFVSNKYFSILEETFYKIDTFASVHTLSPISSNTELSPFW